MIDCLFSMYKGIDLSPSNTHAQIYTHTHILQSFYKIHCNTLSTGVVYSFSVADTLPTGGYLGRVRSSQSLLNPQDATRRASKGSHPVEAEHRPGVLSHLESYRVQSHTNQLR